MTHFPSFKLPTSISLVSQSVFSKTTMNMTGKEILQEMKEETYFASIPIFCPVSSEEKLKMQKQITHGHHLVKGKSDHDMEDYVVSELKYVDNNEVGLFAIYDGHKGQKVASYLQANLFDNILKEHDFWTNMESAIRRAYHKTDAQILESSFSLGKGGSTAVTAILINRLTLIVANLGDSRAIISKKGVAKQLSVDHEPSRDKKIIESKGGFVSSFPGDVPRVDGQLAVARAFGNKRLKRHLCSEPDVAVEFIDGDTEYVILASDGLWKVMSNQDAVDSIKHIKDVQSAAEHLIEKAISRKSRDDISCIVVKFR